MMELVDWLDDLCVRFIINLPFEELQEAERICFQIEEAQWFYEDFIRPLDPENLPSLNLRNFYMFISRHCPMLSDFPAEVHDEAFQRFLAYKTRVPVRGAIMLNENMDEVVLVKGWKKNANWSFPRGKINKEESDLDCAIREVYEETGLDLRVAGLVSDGESTKSIEVIMREQHMKLFVFRNVPMDTHFEPRTRKEISKIQWYKLSELPTVKKNKQQQGGNGENLAGNANKFYMVAPFLGPLKKWIGQQRRHDKSKSVSQTLAVPNISHADVAVDSDYQNVDEGSRDDQGFSTLMDLLRKPTSQETSNLPEVTPAMSLPKQRKSQHPAAAPLVTDNTAAPNKADLLALLWSGTSKPEAPPQTPAAQVIQEPQMPHSPPHHHLSRVPTLPVATLASMLPEKSEPMAKTISDNPKMRPAPPLTQPAKLIPQGRPQNQKKGVAPAPANVHRAAHAPYQRTGDPRFARETSVSGGEQAVVPQASKLPPPKITAHTAGLLNLFKTGKAAEVSNATSLETPPSARPGISTKPTTLFVPSQVSPVTRSESTSKVQAVTGQQANLLNLFRNPSNPAPTSKSKQEASLQPPLAPVELSAIPTPGHSREPSQIRSPPGQASGTNSSRGPVEGRRAPSQPSLPVSATVNGPLNVPHFEAIAKSAQSPRQATQEKGAKRPRSPQITILPRPGSSHAAHGTERIFKNGSIGFDSSMPPPVKSGDSPPGTSPFKKLTTPIKIPQPPTPNLEARPAPPKPFQPQILRRPGTRHGHNDSQEPSPIQPLPSPHHKPPTSKLQPSVDEHKKSLLSLFTTASPPPAIISPASATPLASAGDNLAAVISPLGEGPESQSIFSGLPIQKSTSQQKHQENKKFKLPTPILTTGASSSKTRDAVNGSGAEPSGENAPTSAGVTENGKAKEPLGSGKQTPNETRDKLLGYLANIRA